MTTDTQHLLHLLVEAVDARVSEVTGSQPIGLTDGSQSRVNHLTDLRAVLKHVLDAKGRSNPKGGTVEHPAEQAARLLGPGFLAELENQRVPHVEETEGDTLLRKVETLEKRVLELRQEIREQSEELLEQARLLGMSGEREADLRGKLGRWQQVARRLRAYVTPPVQPDFQAAKEYPALLSRYDWLQSEEGL